MCATCHRVGRGRARHKEVTAASDQVIQRGVQGLVLGGTAPLRTARQPTERQPQTVLQPGQQQDRALAEPAGTPDDSGQR